MKEYDPRKEIAAQLNFTPRQIEVVSSLMQQGATIPFIARYRKEQTQGMDEVDLFNIQSALKTHEEVYKRRQFICQTLKARNLLTAELESSLSHAKDLVSLEDIYLPYKVKRKTRALKAREKGLLPLAQVIERQSLNESIYNIAKKYVQGAVKNVDEALAGASDILAEKYSETAWVRETLRNDYKKFGRLSTSVVKGKETEGKKFLDYFSLNELISKMPSHRLLAVVRGEREGFLKIKLSVDSKKSLFKIKRRIIRKNGPFHKIISDAIDDSFQRLLHPSLEKEILKYFKTEADKVAIDIFAENLQQLLLSPPLGEKTVLAIDPGFTSGCKIALLDTHGQLIDTDTIFPHSSDHLESKATSTVQKLCMKQTVAAIAVGDGTAGRETIQWLSQIPLKGKPDVYMVSESGASIYSASPVAREEFPDLDVTVRGAISIGRRLIDPLAELIKIDPKSIGVGQYQHDVDQKKLQESLDHTISVCVNKVGINVNTASAHLLQHVSGLGPTLAKNILVYRKANNGFKDRDELQKVPRMGTRAFEQCAGFLRIKDGNNILDNTGVHPESYDLVSHICQDLNCDIEKVVDDPEILKKMDKTRYFGNGIGLPTIDDIITELEKPGLDPRGAATPFSFDDRIKDISDLKKGMVVPGIITNVTKFGCFVNMGIKQDGLIHISVIGPNKLYVQQPVKVEVLDIDINRQRINLKPFVEANQGSLKQ